MSSRDRTLWSVSVVRSNYFCGSVKHLLRGANVQVTVFDHMTVISLVSFQLISNISVIEETYTNFAANLNLLLMH